MCTVGVLGLITVCALVIVANANASWPKLAGKASVFGNDPLQGFTDPSDSGITALGTPTSRGGLAVYRYGTLGGWWKVCPPKGWHRRCHLIRQTDIGPAPWTGRIVDLTAVAARRAWGLRVRSFPTDVGRWRIHYRGRRR